ncbi:hypothetical protein CHARACLAT_032799 [Characodon lateralis]|uniref:Uncharacterized protein n=1 Tax=Characodon lateralis TaxID=208331 RepID=A0ABU7EI15_9TELE|nr:hypothetical protein [Characodon lateralis]
MHLFQNIGGCLWMKNMILALCFEKRTKYETEMEIAKHFPKVTKRKIRLTGLGVIKVVCSLPAGRARRRILSSEYHEDLQRFDAKKRKLIKPLKFCTCSVHKTQDRGL